MTSAGISRSGRIRKKSAKLMEMETVEDGELPEFPKQQNMMKIKKLDKTIEDDDDDDDDDDDSDSNSDVDEPFFEKVSPIRIPKSPVMSTLPVKKRPSMMGHQTSTPVPALIQPKIPQKVSVMSQKVTTKANIQQKSVQPKPMMMQKSMNQKTIMNAKAKVQQMMPRIGIVPNGSTSSSSSSSSSSSTTSDSSESNSDSDSEMDKKGQMMGMNKMPPMVLTSGVMNKPKPQMMQITQKNIKKDKPRPQLMPKPMPMHMMSEGSEAMMSLDDDDDDDDDSTTTSSESLDETEDNLRIVEEPVQKQKKFVKKKESARKPMNKNAKAAASANAAATVLANLGNPAALQNRSFPILGSSKPTKKVSSPKKPGRPKTQKRPPKPEKIKTRPMTAYMLWCQHNRKKIVSKFPNMDFSMISKKMGEVWQSLQDKEKMAWKRKAKKLANKRLTFISTGKSSDLKLLTQSLLTASTIRPMDESSRSSVFGQDFVRPNDTAPIDIAAHLKLLGESLSIIGQRLTEHEGQIAVSGSLSVLLDSTLCALAPLLALTAQVEPLNGSSQEVLGSTLDNVAYIMPGL